MTIYEYNELLFQLEMSYINDLQNDELLSKKLEMAIKCRKMTQCPPKVHFTPLDHELMRIVPEKTRELHFIFDYYDARDKFYAKLPKSLFPATSHPIRDTKEVKLKQLNLPRELKRFGSQGYEIALETIAHALQMQTSSYYTLNNQ